MRPEIRLIGEGSWPRGAHQMTRANYRGELAKVHCGVNLVAGTIDVRPVDEGVAYRGTQARSDLVANTHRHFGNGDKLVVRPPASVRWQSEEAARLGDRCLARLEEER